MSFFWILVFSSGCLWLWLRLWQSERIIRKLSKAVETKRRFLLRDAGQLGRSQNLEHLVTSTNALIDAYAQDSSKTSDFSNQLEATLGSIQAAIFILNEEHSIDYSNESSEQIFNLGKAMRGLRLESLVRYVDLWSLCFSYITRFLYGIRCLFVAFLTTPLSQLRRRSNIHPTTKTEMLNK